ncbi:unnamed protein product [Linum tenue]|uniref:BHLH domain-containing protein n=1 Tax=Linum tenue TaxID=586396 RepID=A0AAV0QKG0_9ROSI|nr:unnamed protein product [Linum tenue]
MLAIDHDQLQFNCLLPPHQDYAIPEPLFEFDSDSFLPYFSSSYDDHNLISLCPEIFPLNGLDNFPYSYHCDQNPDFFYCCTEPSLFPGFPAPATVDFLDDIPVPAAPLPAPTFEPPAEPSGGKEDEEVMNKKQGNGDGVTLSAQSIAARHRRRRITQKTQELGKLIPGGNKLNTAEMFQAAAQYVKFLQAQISVLQSMDSPQTIQEPIEVPKELQTLVTSPVIQQKMYSEEKCFVPTELLQKLVHRSEVQSKPMVMKEIDVLLLNKQH